MRNLLLLIPILVVLACNIGISTNLANDTATAQVTPTSTPEPPLTGTITGKLSYPSEFIPPLRVVAFSRTDGKAYFVDTAENQREYALDVPPGFYFVVAYLHEGVAGQTGQVDSYTLGGGPFAGGYTQMVPCGLSVDCNDHSLLLVTVDADQTATADPGDWYAPEGTFPLMPNP